MNIWATLGARTKSWALVGTRKELVKLESKKKGAETKAAEAVLKKLLASGMTADEILEKLK